MRVVASEAVAAQAKNELHDERPDIKVVQIDFDFAANQETVDRKTVRSGSVYDLDAQERRRKELERADRLKKEIGEGPITGIEGRRAYRVVKRAFDIVFSAAVLICFCWLFVIIAILIKIDDPKGPVFFKQERVGLNGKTFKMLKFRSM